MFNACVIILEKNMKMLFINLFNGKATKKEKEQKEKKQPNGVTIFRVPFSKCQSSDLKCFHSLVGSIQLHNIFSFADLKKRRTAFFLQFLWACFSPKDQSSCPCPRLTLLSLLAFVSLATICHSHSTLEFIMYRCFG